MPNTVRKAGITSRRRLLLFQFAG
ncbi:MULTISPECIES: hypothetical protein [unclassified Escherichia]|nr:MULTISPECIES: hypothetical protein [unclassified Escherichia]